MQTLIQSAGTNAIPLLLAALAVLISSRAGVLNIGVEGLMLGGGFMAGWVGAGHGAGAGFAAAVGAGLVAALILAWLMVILRADQVVLGIAFNILVLGLTSYAFGIITSRNPDGMTVGQAGSLKIPGLGDIPYVGVLFDMQPIAYLAYALVPVTWFVLFRTGFGVRLRACGEYVEGAHAVGVDIVRVRLLATAVSGMVAAAGGAFLVLGDVGLFRQNMSGGRGYIAFVIVILARYRPLGALLGAAGFGLAQASTFYLQLHGVKIPPELIGATPYVATMLAIILLGRRIGHPPAEEGRPLYLSR
jgi:general nucleoside transport system permease protein